jgi:hypothetical protein
MTVFVHSFDYLSTAQLGQYWDTVNGGGTVATLTATAARDGTQGLRVLNGLGAVYKVFPFPGPPSSLWAGISFQFVGTPATGSANILMFLDTFGNGQCSVAVDATGHVTLQQIEATATPLATSTLTMTAGAWYSVQAYAGLGPTTALHPDEMQVYVDDGSGSGPVLWASRDQVSFRWQSNNTLSGVRVGNGSAGGTPDYRYDNLYVSNEGAKSDLRVDALYPNGAGTFGTGWPTQVGGTGGQPYTAVNETPNDGDTSYLLAGGSGILQTFSMQNLVGAATLISVVQAVASVRDEPGAARDVAAILYSGPSSLTGKFITPGSAGYQYFFVSSTIDPNTLAAWTHVGVQSAEAGVMTDVTSGNVRCSQVVMEVGYPNPSGTGTGVAALARAWVSD